MTEPANAAQDIALLFARDPLQHTDRDIDAMIEKMRSARSTFNTTGKPVKVAAEKPVKTAKEVLNLDLGSLDL